MILCALHKYIFRLLPIIMLLSLVMIMNCCSSEDNDGDGATDDEDNCIFVKNANQSDTDGDGIGDACEPDTDDDGVIDDIDNCIGIPNPGQDDMDNDSIGDACDDDNDNDGVNDFDDNCPGIANPGQEDADGNGIGDVCDDRDNDGINDVYDNCPDISNPVQEDVDGDGIGDACDPVKIVYRFYDEVSLNVYLYTMDADGRNVTQITSGDPVHDDWPSLTNDGNKVAFARRMPGNLYSIFIWKADTTGLRLVTTGYDDTAPHISPDGTKIVFTRQTGANSSERDIFVVNEFGKLLDRLTFDQSSRSPNWSPDGNWIAYISNENLYTLALADPETQIPLTEDGDGGTAYNSPTFSSDGSVIAFTGSGSGASDILMVYNNGTIQTPTDITTSPSTYEKDCAFSPFENILIFHQFSFTPLSSTIVAKNLENGVEKDLKYECWTDPRPDW